MKKRNDEALESPFEIPTADVDSLDANDIQIDEDGRRYVVVDGRRFILEDDANDEDEGVARRVSRKNVDFDALPPNPREATIPTPPRTVSTTAKLALFGASTATASFGRIWLCFSMIFVFAFLGLTGSGAMVYERFGSWEPFANGTIISCEKTNVEINGRTPKEWRFEGIAPDGSRFEGASFSFGYVDAGEKVQIERKSGTENVLRVVGTTLSTFGDSIMFFVLVTIFLGVFIGIGVGMAIVGPTRKALKALPLMRRGVVGRAVCVDVSDTGTRVNGNAIQKVACRFKAGDGKIYDAQTSALDVSKLTDEPTEIVLYDPENPTRSILFDDLPKGVKLNRRGAFGANPLRLIVPTIFALIILFEVAATIRYACRIETATFGPVAEASADDAQTATQGE